MGKATVTPADIEAADSAPFKESCLWVDSAIHTICFMIVTALVLGGGVCIAIAASSSASASAKYDPDEILPLYSFEPLPVAVSYSGGGRRPYKVSLSATVTIENPTVQVAYGCASASGPITGLGPDVYGAVDVGSVHLDPSSSVKLPVAARFFAGQPLDFDGQELGLSFNVSSVIDVSNWQVGLSCFAVECRVRFKKSAVGGSGAVVSSSWCSRHGFPC